MQQHRENVSFEKNSRLEKHNKGNDNVIIAHLGMESCVK